MRKWDATTFSCGDCHIGEPQNRLLDAAGLPRNVDPTT
jgi:hypothetical protein